VSVAGLTIFDAPPLRILDQAGFSIAHYAGDLGVWWHYLLPAWWGGFALAGAVLAAGAMATAFAWLRSRARPAGVPGPVRACVVAAALLALAYAITPGSASGLDGQPALAQANTRYGVAALIAAAPAAAWWAARLGRTRPLAELVLLAAICAGVGRNIDPYLARAAAIALALAILAALLLALRRRGSLGGWDAVAPMWRRRLAISAAAALVLAGYAAERNFNRGLYRGIDPTFDGILAATPPDRRVGIAGRWSVAGYAPVWPVFGTRLENRVEYVGPERRGVLREYGSQAAFTRALQAGAYDFLLVGLGSRPQASVRYEAWARDAGYIPLTRSPRLVLLAAPAEPGHRASGAAA